MHVWPAHRLAIRTPCLAAVDFIQGSGHHVQQADRIRAIPTDPELLGAGLLRRIG
jgi:hypothetical protein